MSQFKLLEVGWVMLKLEMVGVEALGEMKVDPEKREHDASVNYQTVEFSTPHPPDGKRN